VSTYLLLSAVDLLTAGGGCGVMMIIMLNVNFITCGKGSLPGCFFALLCFLLLAISSCYFK
jgi:hypothetical protein